MPRWVVSPLLVPFSFEGLIDMAYMTFDVDSTAVEELGYDNELELLYITYSGGGEYTYFDVPMEIAMACASAESVGVFVNTQIKGVYESEEGHLSSHSRAVDWDVVQHVYAAIRDARGDIDDELDAVNVEDANLAALRKVADTLDELQVDVARIMDGMRRA